VSAVDLRRALLLKETARAAEKKTEKTRSAKLRDSISAWSFLEKPKRFRKGGAPKS